MFCIGIHGTFIDFSKIMKKIHEYKLNSCKVLKKFHDYFFSETHSLNYKKQILSKEKVIELNIKKKLFYSFPYETVV